MGVKCRRINVYIFTRVKEEGQNVTPMRARRWERDEGSVRSLIITVSEAGR